MPTQNQNQPTSFWDLLKLPKGIGSISPNTETFLSAIPQLFGAYESAKGVPIGAPISVLGNLLNQHSGYRTQQNNLGALQQQVSGLNLAQTPGALALRNALPPSSANASPDFMEKQLSNILAQYSSEITKQAGIRPPSNVYQGAYDSYIKANPDDYQGAQAAGTDAETKYQLAVRKPPADKIPSSVYSGASMAYLKVHPGDYQGAAAAGYDAERKLRLSTQKPDRDRKAVVKMPDGSSVVFNFDTGEKTPIPGTGMALAKPLTSKGRADLLAKAQEIAKNNLTSSTSTMLGLGAPAKKIPSAEELRAETARVLKGFGYDEYVNPLTKEGTTSSY